MPPNFLANRPALIESFFFELEFRRIFDFSRLVHLESPVCN
jgi:hypothetical protein